MQEQGGNTSPSAFLSCSGYGQKMPVFQPVSRYFSEVFEVPQQCYLHSLLCTGSPAFEVDGFRKVKYILLEVKQIT